MRSEVQVFPGPPCPLAPATVRGAVVFWYGAIAQLGERVLCKHEVVGSIPSGSTSLRWRCQLRLGEPFSAKLLIEARNIRRLRNIDFASVILRDASCGISDIVKRRSIRVMDRKVKLRGFSVHHPFHYLRTVFGARPSQDDRVVKWFFRRRLTASPSVRSYEAKLVFLYQCPVAMLLLKRGPSAFCRVCGH